MSTQLRYSERITGTGNVVSLDTIRFNAGHTSHTGELLSRDDDRVRYATRLCEGLTVVYYVESCVVSAAIDMHEYLAKWYDLKEVK